MGEKEVSAELVSAITPFEVTSMSAELQPQSSAALASEIRPQEASGLQIQLIPIPGVTSIGLQGSLVPGSAQAIWDHINNKDNPHQTTAEEVGAVSISLQNYPELTYQDLMTERRQRSSVYVDSNLEPMRITLETLKLLNTKIIITESLDTIDLANLTVGDYIGTVIEET